MPGIELSSLSGVEIQRLLAAAEQREQKALAERLRAELVARRSRVAAIPAALVRIPEPAAPFEAEDAAVRVKPALLAVAAAAVVAMGVGWGLAQAPGRPPAPRPALPSPIVAPPTLTVEVAPEPAARPTPPPAVRPKVAARRAPACHASRMVCASPRLLAQDRRMRRAYDRALAAGADRLAVDRAQARWRATLTRTGSAARAAQLYDRRIRELEAIARRARR